MLAPRFRVEGDALAVLVARWNRVTPTVVYEDVRGELTYQAAVTVDA